MRNNTILLSVILSLLLVVSLSLIGLIVYDLGSYSDADFINNAEQAQNTNSGNSLTVDNSEKKADEIKQEDKVDSAYLMKIEALDEPVREVVREHVSKTKKKLDLSAPVVASAVVQQAQNLSKDVRVIVQVKDIAFKQNVLSSLTPEEFELRLDGSDWFSGSINNQSLAKLQNNILVERVDVNRKMRSATAESFPLVNSTLVTNKEIVGVTVNGSNQNVCLIDTGIKYNHPELGGNGQFEDGSGNRIGTKVIEGRDYCGNGQTCTAETSNPLDSFGHGTGMASIIGADSATFTGMAPGANFVALRVTDTDITDTDVVIKGVEWCVNNATKFNLSVMYIGLASVGDLFAGIENEAVNCNDVLHNKIKLAVAANMTVITPSGQGTLTSDGGHIDGISYPACMDDTISVGGVEDGSGTTVRDRFWNSSNRYPGILDMVAPAEDIDRLTLVGHANAFGTSEAAAHVAGAAVLLKDFYQQKYGIVLHHNQTRDILTKTGINITDTFTGNKYPRLDVWRAINYEEYPPNIQLLTANNSLFNQNVQLLYNASDDHNLYNCTLFVNDAANQTNISLPSNSVQNFSLTSGSGNYTWKVQCYDNSTFPNVNTSLVNTIRVDADLPIVNLESPSNNSVLTALPVVFDYNVTEATTNISNCTLFINSTANETNTTVLTGVTQNFTLNLSNGNYNWSVKCYDYVNNLGFSVENNFSVKVNSAPSVTGASLLPASPNTNSLITCTGSGANDLDGDTLTHSYRFNDSTGTLQAFGASNTLDCSVVGGCDKNDVITCEYKVNDGTVDSNIVVSAGLAIVNSAPTVTSASLTPAVANTSTIITCTGSGAADVDGDTLTHAYKFSDAGGILQAYSAVNTFDCGAVVGCTKGDTITCEYKVNDGTVDSNIVTSAGLAIDNAAPTMNAITGQVTDEDTQANFDLSTVSNDIDGDTLTYAIVAENVAQVDCNIIGSTLQMLPAQDYVGGANCDVRANDGTVNSNTQTVSITVNAVNDAPTFLQNLANLSVDEDSQLYYDVNCTDVDNLTLIYYANKSELNINSADGTFTWLPANADVGNHTVNFTCGDGLLNNSQQIVIEVKNVNDAPVLNTITAQNINEESGLNTLDLSTFASDVDLGDTISFVLDAENAAQVDCNINGNNLEFTPQLNFNGTASCDVHAKDLANAVSVTRTVTINVANVNDAPTLNVLADKTYAEDSGLQDNIFDLHASAADVETAVAELTYAIQAQTNNSMVNCVIDGNRFVDCTTQQDASGINDVTVRVTDPQNAFADRTFRVTITAVNDAPTVTSAALSPATANTNTLFTCAGSGKNDIDGDTLTEQYEFSDTNGVLQAFSAANTLDCGAVNGCDKNDAITCKYKVNDGIVDSNVVASSSVTVQNTAPTIASASLAPAAPNTNSVLTCSANTVADVDGDTISLSYEFSDTNGVLQAFSAANTLDCGAVTGCDNGDTITCKAKGNDGTADSNIAASTGVLVGNSAPTVTSASLLPATPKTNDVLTCTGSGANDPDGQTLTHKYQFKSDGTIIQAFSATDTLDCNAVTNCDKADTITCEYKANDGTFDSNVAASTGVAIANTAPSVVSTALTPATANTNTVFTCTGSGSSDADGDTLTTQYQFKDTGGVLQAFSAVNTFDCATAGCDKNDAITCEYKVNDGSADSSIVTSTGVSVSNTAPTIASSSLTPANAVTNTVFTCSANTVADADGDTITLSYQFEDGQGVLQAFSATATFDCGTVTGCDKADTITCKAKGNDGAVDSNTVTSTGVGVSNSAPTVTSASLSPSTADTNTLFTCTGSGKTDLDSDTLAESFEFSDANGVLQAFSATNTFNCGSVTGCDKNDAITCKYKVNDGTVDSNIVVSSTVTVANTAPVLNAISLQTTNEDTQKTFDLSTVASDVDGDALTYSIVAEDAAKVDCSVAGNNLVMVPALNYNGAASCDVRANDGTVNSNTQTVSMTVNAVNDAPTLSALSDKTYAEDSGLQNDIFDLHALAADVETAANGLTYTIQSQSNAAVVNCVVDGNKFVDCTTLQDASGINDVTVRVTDPQNEFAERTFRVTITPLNDAPTVASTALSPATADTSTAFTCTGAGKADVDNTIQQLTDLYQFEDDSGVLQQFSATNTYSCVSAGCDKNDNVKCKYKVNDGNLDSNVAVSNVVTVQNTAPTVASASLTPTTANTNTLFTCTGSGAADVDGDTLTNLYQFKDAAGILQQFSATATFNCGSVAGCDLGDTITCEHKVNDGSTDSNIVASNSVNIVDMPDLIVEQLKVVLPAAPNTNELTLIRFFIRNIGNVNTNNVGWNLNYQDGSVSQANLVNIAVGQSHLVNQYIQFTATGMHILTATADPNNSIAELDETNNALSIQKNVS